MAQAGASQVRLRIQGRAARDGGLDLLGGEAAVVAQDVPADDVGVLDPLCHLVQPREHPHDLLVDGEQRFLQSRGLLI